MLDPRGDYQLMFSPFLHSGDKQQHESECKWAARQTCSACNNPNNRNRRVKLQKLQLVYVWQNAVRCEPHETSLRSALALTLTASIPTLCDYSRVCSTNQRALPVSVSCQVVAAVRWSPTGTRVRSLNTHSRNCKDNGFSFACEWVMNKECLWMKEWSKHTKKKWIILLKLTKKKSNFALISFCL